MSVISEVQKASQPVPVEEDRPPQDRKEARRLQAWKLWQKGWKQTDIAEALGVPAGAVSQWMSRAQKGEGNGKEALRSQKRSGRPPRLTSGASGVAGAFEKGSRALRLSRRGVDARSRR